MSKTSQKDWMESLVKNFKVPIEKQSKKILTESQLKKILKND